MLGHQSKKSFCLFHWGLGSTAMDMTIRDLAADELERVFGGDAPNGTGTNDDEMCTTPALIFRVGPREGPCSDSIRANPRE
jgi:hypothetical protein